MGRKDEALKTLEKQYHYSNFRVKLLSTNPVEFCLKKHKMFYTKCNFQSEQTFETPCMAGWVKGKEKFQ